MNARRLPVIAVLGLLALAGLAACRADPAVAAYVDDQRITEAEVDQVTDQLRELVEPSQLSALRDQVVEMRVLTEVAGGYAEQAGLTVPAPDPAQLGAGVGLPPDHPYVQVRAGFEAVMGALRGSVAPVPPTEADQREVYDQLAAEGLTVPFEQVRPDLNEQLLGEPVALRNLLIDVVGRADIRLNPRYDLVHLVPVTVGNGQVWLGVPLGESAVVESG
ncbi:MAG: hypothetical protein GEV12_05935 [Micromonosporaceae bacterium]|nr:hypothetical protein [Micromonosporaceae bacterium]